MRASYKLNVDILQRFYYLSLVLCSKQPKQHLFSFLTNFFFYFDSKGLSCIQFFKWCFSLCSVFYHWQQESISDWSNYRMSSLGSHTGSSGWAVTAKKLLPKTDTVLQISALLTLVVCEDRLTDFRTVLRMSLMISDSAKRPGLSCVILWLVRVFIWVGPSIAFIPDEALSSSQRSAYAFVFRFSMGRPSRVRRRGPTTLHNPLQSICVMIPETALAFPLQHVEGEG